MSPRTKKILLAAGLLISSGVLIALNFGKIVMAVLSPSAPFDPSVLPPPPDYANSLAWTALPTQNDAADAEILGLPSVNQENAPADVFYVHPTSYVGTDWNAHWDDEVVNAATDKGATRIQASAFQGCCAVYAPRYRQANMTAFTTQSPDGQRAVELAGSDVVAAFRFYLEHHNKGRPFVLAAHSQGSVHAFRLLKELSAENAVLERLVVAYLIGGPLSEATLQAVPGLRVCESAQDLGCVIGWNARSPSYAHGIDFIEISGATPASAMSPRVCVNPLTWRPDEGMGEHTLNRGAVFFDASGAPPTPVQAFASARCEGGFLRVELSGKPPRDIASRMLDYALGEGNYHPIEYGLFFVNLRENAQARVQAFIERRRAASPKLK